MRILPALVASGLLLAACASEPPAPGRLVKIEMTEFAFHPKEVRLKAGEIVTLQLANKGTMPHEIMAGRGEIQHSGGYADDVFEGVDIAITGELRPDHSHGGVMVLVDARRTARATFIVPDCPGVYEMGCFEPGHYLSGMVGRIVIE